MKVVDRRLGKKLFATEGGDEEAVAVEVPWMDGDADWVCF